MTSGVAMRADGVGKQYRLGLVRDDFPTLRAAIASGASRLVHRSRRDGGRSGQRFWALRDVSFEVREGEAVGIIGRNGAGKSTLLRILSRITEPTTGEVAMRGRVGSLLEVGTGFHPELTGRENVYLNGAILGMRKAEIDRKFDEIVAFSEIGRFIGTPVKHYSSGMQVRLAFAVAAHLETEILIADEVLAVGDAAFQKKCLGKMRSVARQGRTVLFVSHNLAAVRMLCDRGVLLRDGAVSMDGGVAEVVRAYLQGLETAASRDLLERRDRNGTGEACLAGVEISTAGRASGILVAGAPARFVFHVTRALPGISCSFTLYDELGQPVTAFDSSVRAPGDDVDSGADSRFTCDVDALPLVPGRYRLNAAIARDGELLDHLEAAALLDVDHGTIGGRPVSDDARYGSVVLPHRWTVPAPARPGR